MKQLATILILIGISSALFAQQTVTQYVYKKVDTLSLTLDIYYPPSMDESKKYPAMIYFFGGGWVGGSTAQFEPHAKYFSERGLISVLADYRVKNKHKTPNTIIYL